jgi:peptidoglycan hydrolase-like protein with peptidoglycan-binding domain
MTASPHATVPASTSARRSLAALLGAALIVGMPTLAGVPALATEPTPTPSASPATPATPATPTDAATPATPATPAVFSLGERTLRRGDKGPDVKKLQKLLKVKRTGTFNKRTKKAVKKVQRAAGLKANGVVTKKTLKAIKKADKARKRAAKAATSSRSLSRAGSPSASKAYARGYIASKYGWGSGQMSCLASLWERESGWRYWVSNPNGIYRGIPQTSSRVWGALGYSTSQYMNSPEIQIKVGTHYIKGRYGTPCSAWSFWQSRHWY